MITGVEHPIGTNGQRAEHAHKVSLVIGGCVLALLNLFLQQRYRFGLVIMGKVADRVKDRPNTSLSSTDSGFFRRSAVNIVRICSGAADPSR